MNGSNITLRYNELYEISLRRNLTKSQNNVMAMNEIYRANINRHLQRSQNQTGKDPVRKTPSYSSYKNNSIPNSQSSSNESSQQGSLELFSQSKLSQSYSLHNSEYSVESYQPNLKSQSQRSKDVYDKKKDGEWSDKIDKLPIELYRKRTDEMRDRFSLETFLQGIQQQVDKIQKFADVLKEQLNYNSESHKEFCQSIGNTVNENLKQSMEQCCRQILESKISTEDFQNLKSSIAVLRRENELLISQLDEMREREQRYLQLLDTTYQSRSQVSQMQINDRHKEDTTTQSSLEFRKTNRILDSASGIDRVSSVMQRLSSFCKPEDNYNPRQHCNENSNNSELRQTINSISSYCEVDTPISADTGCTEEKNNHQKQTQISLSDVASQLFFESDSDESICMHFPDDSKKSSCNNDRNENANSENGNFSIKHETAGTITINSALGHPLTSRYKTSKSKKRPSLPLKQSPSKRQLRYSLRKVRQW
ncbi:hypothetical protein TrispH2_004703 [Trichoplax sp. H2]|nr:hypothetical protein TrispH2_004703 [Trichoplax sp. H2]|eukprot:RDD43793.1 hypothetical protein TrispH2_004703 [Trichoplax sp. H2]